MNNKEILPEDGLPVYDVEEMSLLDAMILLKHSEQGKGQSTIERAIERLNPAYKSAQVDSSRAASGR
ncbi:MAG: hypothetical protein P8163_14950 [Candidatus Thiodiazotropha sp.]